MPVVEKGMLVGVVSRKDILKGLESGTLRDLTVQDVMTKEVVRVASADLAVNVARIMSEKGINRVPVVDNDKLVGIVTRGDIIKAAAECE